MIKSNSKVNTLANTNYFQGGVEDINLNILISFADVKREKTLLELPWRFVQEVVLTLGRHW